MVSILNGNRTQHTLHLLPIKLVRKVGVEPTQPEARDLQSRVTLQLHRLRILMVGPVSRFNTLPTYLANHKGYDPFSTV